MEFTFLGGWGEKTQQMILGNMWKLYEIPILVSVKFLETQSSSFINILSLDTFALQRQS